MKYRAFIKELENEGVIAKEGTKHCKLIFNGKYSIINHHKSKEITNVYANVIRKQLGLPQK